MPSPGHRPRLGLPHVQGRNPEGGIAVRVLDRRVEFDPRSRDYPIRTLLPAHQPRSYVWPCATYLDQGEQGACVGFAWAHDLAARPKQRKVDTQLAQKLYQHAQRLDQWPGEDYSGTSVLAGAKAVQAVALLGEYRWAFNLDDLLTAIGTTGPAVLGINWYSGMWDTDPKGYVHATGTLMGGHAILARGVNLRTESVLLHNSWGRHWGRHGTARLSFTDLNRLLREDGECCIPVTRQ